MLVGIYQGHTEARGCYSASSTMGPERGTFGRGVLRGKHPGDLGNANISRLQSWPRWAFKGIVSTTYGVYLVYSFVGRLQEADIHRHWLRSCHHRDISFLWLPTRSVYLTWKFLPWFCSPYGRFIPMVSILIFILPVPSPPFPDCYSYSPEYRF